MKSLLLIFAMLLCAAQSNAQTMKSTVIESSKNIDLGDRDNVIKNRVENDLTIIEEKSTLWKNDAKDSTEDLKDTQNEMANAVSVIESKGEQPRDNETDPASKNYSKKLVPSCKSSNPRLAYKDNQWKCLPQVECEDVYPNLTGFEMDSATGKCKRPVTYWAYTSWSSCTNSKKTRSVKCSSTKIYSSSSPTYPNSMCTGPKPATTVDCN